MNYSARAQHGEWSLLRVNSSTQEAGTQLQQIQNQLGLHSLKQTKSPRTKEPKRKYSTKLKKKIDIQNHRFAVSQSIQYNSLKRCHFMKYYVVCTSLN